MRPTSALCQAEIAAPLRPTKSETNATASSDFAFTDINGERFLPFGFYQYTVTRTWTSDFRAKRPCTVRQTRFARPIASTPPYSVLTPTHRLSWVRVGQLTTQ